MLVLRVSASETNITKLLKLFIMAGMNSRLGGKILNGQSDVFELISTLRATGTQAHSYAPVAVQ